jgi:hypothetical protein
VKQSSEPIFNVPLVVSVTIGALIVVHAVRALLLTETQDFEFLLAFALPPRRFRVAGALMSGRS